MLMLSLTLQFTAFAQDSQTYYPISKFVDGDTFWIRKADGKEEKIRLIGIDAPESRNTGKKQEHPLGKASAAYLQRLLTGQTVRLAYDVSKYDRYKRTLAYVYLKDGTFVNAHMVQQGYAQVLTIPPNVKHADLFLKMEREARAKKRGLWK
jgi:micrococcal nuclease